MFHKQICVTSMSRTVQGTQFQIISYTVCSEINSHVHVKKISNKSYKILFCSEETLMLNVRLF